jgi:hypothetical protein
MSDNTTAGRFVAFVVGGVVMTFLIATFGMFPVALIWSLNTLLGLDIQIGLASWSAALFWLFLLTVRIKLSSS